MNGGGLIRRRGKPEKASSPAKAVQASAVMLLCVASAGAAQPLLTAAVRDMDQAKGTLTVRVFNQSAKTVTACVLALRCPNASCQRGPISADYWEELVKSRARRFEVQAFGPGSSRDFKVFFQGNVVPHPDVVAVIFSDRTWMGDRKAVDGILEKRQVQYDLVSRVMPILESNAKRWKGVPRRAVVETSEVLRVSAEKELRNSHSPAETSRAWLLETWARTIKSIGDPEDDWDVANDLDKLLDDLQAKHKLLREQAFLPE